MQLPFVASALALLLAAGPVARAAQDEAPAPLRAVEDVPERLRALAAAHPGRARLEQVGRSLSGREILALRLGPADGEPPGLLAVAGLDGRRLGDTQALLLLAERLLSGAEPAAAATLADASLTVIPLANPDGAAALLGQDGPVRECAGNGRPDDADRDGRLDEDGPDDLDGDGVIAWMRVPDAEGEWVLDAHDPRALRRARRERGERGSHRLLAEGRDDDRDGVESEDGRDGVQPDRNFMHGWKEHDPASGVVPLSEPEALALCEFVQARPWLFAVLVVGAQDTLVELPKGEAEPPDDWESPLATLLQDDRAALEEVQRRLHELPGGKDHKVKGEGLAGGSFLAWSYHQAGRLPLALRLWEPPTKLEPGKETPEDDAAAGKDGETADAAAPDQDEPAKKEDQGKPDEKQPDESDDEAGSDASSPVPAAVLAWLDQEHAGAGIRPWTSFAHPELGEVEIGGLLPGTLLVTPPEVVSAKAPLLAGLVLAVLEARPQLGFEDVRAERGADGLYTVHAALVDRGALPSLTALAASARTTRPVLVRLELPEGGARLAGPTAARADRLAGGGGRQEFRWVVAAAAGDVVRLVADADALPRLTQEVTLP